MKDTSSAGRKNLIMRIYLYFFMGVGLIMMSVGTFGLGQNLYKSALFPKYPLEGMESRCDYIDSYPYPAKIEGQTDVDLKTMIEQNKLQAEKCRTSLEEERRTKQITDFYNSVITIVIGLVLFGGHLAVNLRVANKS